MDGGEGFEAEVAAVSGEGDAESDLVRRRDSIHGSGAVLYFAGSLRKWELSGGGGDCRCF